MRTQPHPPRRWFGILPSNLPPSSSVPIVVRLTLRTFSPKELAEDPPRDLTTSSKTCTASDNSRGERERPILRQPSRASSPMRLDRFRSTYKLEFDAQLTYHLRRKWTMCEGAEYFRTDHIHEADRSIPYRPNCDSHVKIRPS